jgi:hypothetical protein
MRRLYAVLIAHTVASYAAFFLTPVFQPAVAPAGISDKSFERMRANTPRDPGDYVEMIVGPPILALPCFVDYSIGADRFLKMGRFDAGPLAFVLTYPTVGVSLYLLLRFWHRKRVASG